MSNFTNKLHNFPNRHGNILDSWGLTMAPGAPGCPAGPGSPFPPSGPGLPPSPPGPGGPALPYSKRKR